MPAIFPVIEGDEEPTLTRNFSGKKLAEHYDQLAMLAVQGGYTPLQAFEYIDADLLEEFEAELPDAQIEWHPFDQGFASLSRLIADPNLPADEELKEEIQELLELLDMLKQNPQTSKGWRLQLDI